MRILLVNTSDSVGGAAIACRRLMEALTLCGVEVRMLTAPRKRGLWCKAVERLLLLPFMGFSWRKSWSIDVNWLGTDITQTEEYEWADVVHLHWVNQGMVSMRQLRRLAEGGKPLVWTMHDIWNATAVCHLTLDCPQFRDRCQHCPMTCDALARHTWQQKQRLYASAHIRFTTCSEWLRGQALESGLMHNQDVTAIPNPIDTRIFHPSSREDARRMLGIADDKLPLVLFVAQRLDNPNKGFRYLVDAMQRLNATASVGLIVMGSGGNEVAAALPGVTIYDLGYQSDAHHIAKIYAAADVFVLPSLSENLPNTIMEAMACGVPCVGFEIGGIPEMIAHKATGYVAKPHDAESLKEGIAYCLDASNRSRLSEACLTKVAATYSQTAVAKRFLELYEQ